MNLEGFQTLCLKHYKMGELRKILFGKTMHRKECQDEKIKEAAVKSARFNRRRSAVKEVRNFIYLFHICRIW